MSQLALFGEHAAVVEDFSAYVAALVPIIAALYRPPVDEYTLEVARGGLAHFRHCLRCGDTMCAPLWIAYFERMRTQGYHAAQAVYPQTFRWVGWGNPHVVAARELHGDEAK